MKSSHISSCGISYIYGLLCFHVFWTFPGFVLFLLGLVRLVWAFPGFRGSSYKSSYRSIYIARLLCALLGLSELLWASIGFSVFLIPELFSDLAIALTIALDVAPGLHVLFWVVLAFAGLYLAVLCFPLLF